MPDETETAGIAEGYLSECEGHVRTLEWQLSEATKAATESRAEIARLREELERIELDYDIVSGGLRGIRADLDAASADRDRWQRRAEELEERNLLALMDRVADWGEVQFPGSTWQSKGGHLVEEAEEARDAANNRPEELADVLMILAHMVREARVDIYAEVERKLTICQARKWLPPDEHGVVRHADSKRLSELAQMTRRAELAERVVEAARGLNVSLYHGGHMDYVKRAISAYDADHAAVREETAG